MKRFLVLIIFCVIGSKAFAQQSNSFVYLDSLIIHGNTAVFKTKQDAKSIVEYLKKKYKHAKFEVAGGMAEQLSDARAYTIENIEIIRGNENILLLKFDSAEINSIEFSVWDNKVVFPTDSVALFNKIASVIKEIDKNKVEKIVQIENVYANSVYLNFDGELKDYKAEFVSYVDSHTSKIENDFFSAKFSEKHELISFESSFSAETCAAIVDYFNTTRFVEKLNKIGEKKCEISNDLFANKEKYVNSLLDSLNKVSSFRRTQKLDDQMYFYNGPKVWFGNYFNKTKWHLIVNLCDEIRIYEFVNKKPKLVYSGDCTVEEMVFLEDLSSDTIPEIRVTSFPNMNGNTFFYLITYDTEKDIFQYAGDLSGEYGYIKEKDLVYSIYAGSWYMPVVYEVYRWESGKLELIEGHETTLIQDPFPYIGYTVFYKNENGTQKQTDISWGDDNKKEDFNKKYGIPHDY